MNKIYIKIILIICFSMSLYTYSIYSSAFQEEIETDNSLLEWHNELLKHKKDSLEHKDKRNKYYHKMIDGFSEKNSFDSLDLVKFSVDHNLQNFTVKKSDTNDTTHQSAESFPLLCHHINIDFSCANEWQVFLLLERLNDVLGNVIRSMEIENKTDSLSVRLVIQNYYVKTTGTDT